MATHLNPSISGIIRPNNATRENLIIRLAGVSISGPVTSRLTHASGRYRRLSRLEDHFTESHILAVQDLIPSCPKSCGQHLIGEVRDMFMRIRAEQDFSIDPLQYPPEPAAVVRRANHQDSAGPKDPPHLRPDVRAVRDMLDHFGIDHRGKAARSEREPIATRPDQQAMTRLQPTQFMLKDVQPNRVGQVLDDPAGSAADVQDALPVFQKAEDDAMPRPLPIPLQPDRTVEGSVIVIGRSNGFF